MNASIINLMSLYLNLNPEFIFNLGLYWVLKTHSYIFYQRNNIIWFYFSKSLWELKKKNILEDSKIKVLLRHELFQKKLKENMEELILIRILNVKSFFSSFLQMQYSISLSSPLINLLLLTRLSLCHSSNT